nr:hypothetical protein [Tanacetum cinerariifolium]
MTLTFADTHNTIAYLIKSDATLTSTPTFSSLGNKKTINSIHSSLSSSHLVLSKLSTINGSALSLPRAVCFWTSQLFIMATWLARKGTYPPLSSKNTYYCSKSELTTAAAPTLTTAPSATRRRKGSKEPKPLKKQAQVEQDEKYARELGAKLNKNIDWDEVIDHVKRKQKEDNAVKRYQTLKRKPQTKAQARKNMMIYPRNVVGFKMVYFKGMTYDDIRPIFEKNFYSNMAFLQKTKEQMDEEDSRALKRLNESQEDKAAKKQKLDKEVEELKRHLQIVPNDEDDIITFTTTQLILVVERRYPLTRFTLDQMLNNVQLEVEEESKVSLELLSFGVDVAMDFKENILIV